jgi:hypothetical protein
MQFSTLFLLSQASLIAAGATKSRRADDRSTFLIYAFGEGIGGLPIFTSGGESNHLTLIFRLRRHKRAVSLTITVS